MKTLDRISNIGSMSENLKETTVESIKEIDIEKLQKNPLNFYNEEYELDDLVNSIEVSGQIEPIIITKDYRIISGHRRYNAIKKLGMDKIKCVIKSNVDKLDEEILLISANKHRKKSQDELIKEIECLTEVYKEKKKIDKNFKGRINDKIAEDLNLSASTVKRLKSTKTEKSKKIKKTKKLKIKDIIEYISMTNIILNEDGLNMEKTKEEVQEDKKLLSLNVNEFKINDNKLVIIVE